jgi:hypothetical protein
VLLRRIGLPILGLVLLVPVVWLGIASQHHKDLILWFGLAAAILAPAAVALMLEAFRTREARVLDDLSRVPEIQDLIARAGTEEERLVALKEERDRLDEIVRLEARRQTLLARQALLRDDAQRILEEFTAIDQEITHLKVDVQTSSALPEIEALEQRLAAYRRGDYVFRIGDRSVVVPRSTFSSLGISGLGAVEPLIAAAARFQAKRAAKRRAKQ